MMRKFSFSFRDTFGSGKSDRKGSRDGPYNSDDSSPPSSPHPGRREALPARIEIDLRLACAGVVNDTIPSDAYVENPYEELGRPQKDYTAWRSHSETNRQWSTSGSKNARNFSNPAANDESFEFPIPKGPLDRSKYAYKPDTALKDLFPEHDQSQFISRAQQSRRRAESTTALDKEATQRVQAGRLASKSFSVASNLPLDQLPVRSKQVRYGSSWRTHINTRIAKLTLPELNHNDTASATATSLATKRARHASYHAPPRLDVDGHISQEKEHERRRKSWYKPFANLVGELQNGGHSHEKRPKSSDSRRSSASSGVIPGGGNVFSWKNFRQSWNSWRESSDFEQDLYEERLNHRRSGASMRKRNTMITNRESTALPSIGQSQGEDEVVPAFPVPSTEQTAEITSPEKPNHILAMWDQPTATDTAVEEEKKTTAEVKKGYRRTMVSFVPMETIVSPTFDDKKDYRRSYSDFSTSHPRMPMTSFNIKRKPVPASRATPTDSLMDGQDVTISPPQEMTTAEEIGILKSTPGVVTVAAPAKVVTLTAKMVSIPAKVVSIPAKKSSVLAKVVAAPLKPAEAKPGETQPSISPASTTDPNLKRRSGQYSWLPVEQEYSATPRSLSLSAKRKSGSYSWLPPESATPPISKRSSMILRRGLSNQSEKTDVTTPTSDTQAGVAMARQSSTHSSVQESTDNAESRTGSIAIKRASGIYTYVVPEIAQATTIQIQRPNRIQVVTPINVASAVPKRIMDKLMDPITGETEFISRDPSVSSESSVEFFNSLKAPQYQYADDISHLGSWEGEVENKTKKPFKWKLGKKKPTTWMDEMEKLGIRDGLLLQDQLDSAPIVRY